MSQPLSFKNPATVAPPVAAYSHLARVKAGTDLLFLAGQVGIAADGSVPATPEEQYAQALRNVVAILESEGAAATDIVRLTTYLVRPLAEGEQPRLRRSILGDIAPATTLIYVPRLTAERYLVEVETIAAKR